MSIILNINKFRYLISVKTLKQNKVTPYSELVPVVPEYREHIISPHTRGCRTVYYSQSGIPEKEIIYPPELWYTQVDSSDPVESTVVDIKNEWPNWYVIEIIKE